MYLYNSADNFIVSNIFKLEYESGRFPLLGSFKMSPICLQFYFNMFFYKVVE